MKNLFCTREESVNWGWKEPNTQLYIEELLSFFDELKYIHVLRHGLDMAFSNNMRQLNNWGWKYNIIITGKETDDELAVKQLDYWIESTKDVLKNLKKYNNRVLFVNHTFFCNQPKKEIDKLLVFADIKITANNKELLYSIPENKGSNNRYKGKDLSIFESQKIEFVKELGFEI